MSVEKFIAKIYRDKTNDKKFIVFSHDKKVKKKFIENLSIKNRQIFYRKISHDKKIDKFFVEFLSINFSNVFLSKFIIVALDYGP